MYLYYSIYDVQLHHMPLWNSSYISRANQFLHHLFHIQKRVWTMRQLSSTTTNYAQRWPSRRFRRRAITAMMQCAWVRRGAKLINLHAPPPARYTRTRCIASSWCPISKRASPQQRNKSYTARVMRLAINPTFRVLEMLMQSRARIYR